ncbi:LOW QUALITY PROTEIN: hypothetical protein Cgig2_028470 [Carnegiea gigantea]|uniref:Uncharacterized protein n=1 Tax=Carnegiea gigantea TaxID=171969 RepID=A0A9Q1K8W6_9CARY|nr:LOW QUALITY PROTEIN: hypothetical protein Cgig2_028470 [Carnegiea gigantea]
MACNKLLLLIERLDYEQWTAAMETSFRGFLSIRTSTIPKDLARLLLQKFDPVSNTLRLSDNRVLETTEKDVHATLAIPMVQIASTCEPKNEHTKLVEQWRIGWNLGRTGSPKVGKMVDQILQRGDHGDEFRRDFVLYIISTCILGSINGDYFFGVLKSLVDVDQIVKYNWCAFLLQCLNDTVAEWKQNSTRYFRGSLLVEFRGKRCKDRWFFIATNWITNAVEQRNKDEKEFPREYGRGKTIERIDYQSIIREGETNLQEEFASVAQENQKHTDPVASTYGPAPAPEPHCSKFGSERGPSMAGPNDPTEVISHIAHGSTNIQKCSNEVKTHGLTQHDHFFNDPEFFNANLKMEAVTLKHYRRQTPIDYTPSTFNLGIPLVDNSCWNQLP